MATKHGSPLSPAASHVVGHGHGHGSTASVRARRLLQLVEGVADDVVRHAQSLRRALDPAPASTADRTETLVADVTCLRGFVALLATELEQAVERADVASGISCAPEIPASVAPRPVGHGP